MNKQKGNFLVNIAGTVISPGFEINDLGFLGRTDRINGHVCSGYKWVTPRRLTRDAWFLGSVYQTSDFEGNILRRGFWQHGFFRLLNYHVLQYAWYQTTDAVNTSRTRGGPKTVMPSEFGGYLYYGSDDRKPLIFRCSGTSVLNRFNDRFHSIGGNVNWNPASNISFTVGPEFFVNRVKYQWINAFADPRATHTYGTRYVFGKLNQKQLSANIRFNWTFTPKLSLQLYMQKLISHGKYSHFSELSRPESDRFNPYPEKNIAVEENIYRIDPDGNGPSPSIKFNKPDFHVKSLRGNALLRWEYSPGSTLYLVWTQTRSDDRYHEDLHFNQSLDRLWCAESNNIFMLKATYWWNL